MTKGRGGKGSSGMANAMGGRGAEVGMAEPLWSGGGGKKAGEQHARGRGRGRKGASWTPTAVEGRPVVPHGESEPGIGHMRQRGSGGKGAAPVASPQSEVAESMERRAKDEIFDEINLVLSGQSVLHPQDFDYRVRQRLHALHGSGGVTRVQASLAMIRAATTSKARSSVKNWPAYLLVLLKKFDAEQTSVAREEKPATDAAAVEAVSAAAVVVHDPQGGDSPIDQWARSLMEAWNDEETPQEGCVAPGAAARERKISKPWTRGRADLPAAHDTNPPASLVGAQAAPCTHVQSTCPPQAPIPFASQTSPAPCLPEAPLLNPFATMPNASTSFPAALDARRRQNNPPPPPPPMAPPVVGGTLAKLMLEAQPPPPPATRAAPWLPPGRWPEPVKSATEPPLQRCTAETWVGCSTVGQPIAAR
mmetsp:Transcript_59343/g.165701  ORF Transcript_59343/g.165701 Transcript_59343/m.165701 type:complete len:420 (+) Transcript_59343:114-1373(+)